LNLFEPFDKSSITVGLDGRLAIVLWHFDDVSVMRSSRLLGVAVVVIISVCAVTYSAIGPTGLSIQSVRIGYESGLVRVGIGGLGSLRITGVSVVEEGLSYTSHESITCDLRVDLGTVTVGLPATLDLNVSRRGCSLAARPDTITVTISGEFTGVLGNTREVSLSGSTGIIEMIFTQT
jgi:hypothetical protein